MDNDKTVTAIREKEGWEKTTVWEQYWNSTVSAPVRLPCAVRQAEQSDTRQGITSIVPLFKTH